MRVRRWRGAVLVRRVRRRGARRRERVNIVVVELVIFVGFGIWFGTSGQSRGGTLTLMTPDWEGSISAAERHGHVIGSDLEAATTFS